MTVMKSDIFAVLMSQIGPWLDHNFPDNLGKAYRPLIGMVEELGELSLAVWKQDTNEVADALGDTCVFMAHYCLEMDFSLEDIYVNRRGGTDCIPNGLFWIGQLCHAHLKLDEGIRGRPEQHLRDADMCLRGLMRYLVVVAVQHDLSLPDVVESVWLKVRQRDWQAYPGTGIPATLK
jgi:hypothetical protein